MTIAFELLASLPQVEASLSDPSLNAIRRRAIATELLQSLPTGLSVRSAPDTFEYIRDRIRHHRDRPDDAVTGPVDHPVKFPRTPKPRQAREA